jgi:predicted RNA-binding protein (virulence factor B family)
MIKIGEDNILKVLRETSVGLFLGDEEGNDVLLPNKYVEDDFKVDDEIKVFIYRDSEDRVIATTLAPKIKVGEFAYLKAKASTSFGTFMDWGLEKDLLIPFRQQATEIEAGKWYVVYMYLDTESDRLVGSTRVNNFINLDEIDLQEGDQISVLVTSVSEIGYSLIVDNQYKGLAYKNETFKKVIPGEKHLAYVKKIREDNRIDISFQKQGYVAVEKNTIKIIEHLMKNNNFLPLNDKSSPEEIVEVLEMSKKIFKKAIGALYKQEIIEIKEDGIYLKD